MTGALRSLGAASAPEAQFESVRALLDLPETRIDLSKAKLTIDRMIDPRIDVAATLVQLDTMASQIRATLPAGASSRARVEAIRSFLYEGKRPFQYDLQDPLGGNIQNKLLPTHLATRKGNCVSMPFLFIVLGQRLGLDLTASTAPEHVFVKFRDETGTWFNLETTSGAGFTSDGWIQKNMPMSAQALANGIYMQPLTKKQTVGVMLGTLMEWYGQQAQHEARMGVANLVLAHDPKDVSAILHISSAYYGMKRREFESKYARPGDVPLPLRPRLLELDQNIHLWRAKAEALGWREPEQGEQQQVVNTGGSVKGAGQ